MQLPYGDQEKSRPETGRRSKLKMYSAGSVRIRTIETSVLRCCSAQFLFQLAIRFLIENDCLQVVSQSVGVLRGFTQHPSLSHASVVAVAHFAFLHLISVRTELVPAECYYILYWKANNPLYLDFKPKTDDDSG